MKAASHRRQRTDGRAFDQLVQPLRNSTFIMEEDHERQEAGAQQAQLLPGDGVAFGLRERRPQMRLQRQRITM
jgi:hypothetical protein